MNCDKKMAIVVREDLETWKKLNVTAFLASGFGTLDVMGENYEDKSGKVYLPLCSQPIIVYMVNKEEMKEILRKAINRDIHLSIYNEEMFSSNVEENSRAIIKRYETDELELVGIGLCGRKTLMDKTLKGYNLHP